MRIRTAQVVLASGLALASCGGDDDSGSTSPPPATSDASDAATTPAGTTGGAPGSTLTAPTTSPATGAAVSSSPATTGAATTDGSECSVTITGAVTAEWTSNVSGPQAFVYGGWLTNPSPEDAGFFGVNCYDSDFNIVGFGSQPDTSIPMEPATYQVTRASGSAELITVDVALLFDEGLWETTSGTLEILEFDDAHIRGTFALEIQDSFDPARTADVSGEFAHSR